jgi:hypothetical protein
VRAERGAGPGGGVADDVGVGRATACTTAFSRLATNVAGSEPSVTVPPVPSEIAFMNDVTWGSVDSGTEYTCAGSTASALETTVLSVLPVTGSGSLRHPGRLPQPLPPDLDPVRCLRRRPPVSQPQLRQPGPLVPVPGPQVPAHRPRRARAEPHPPIPGPLSEDRLPVLSPCFVCPFVLSQIVLSQIVLTRIILDDTID